MPHQQIIDQAGYLYDACTQEIRVSATASHRWEVWNGLGGELVDTVDAAVLDELASSYDMPVLLVEGGYWSASSGASSAAR